MRRIVMLLTVLVLLMAACAPGGTPTSTGPGDIPAANLTASPTFSPQEAQGTLDAAVQATVMAILVETQRADSTLQAGEAINTAIAATVTAITQQTAVMQTVTAVAQASQPSATFTLPPSITPAATFTATPVPSPTRAPDLGIVTTVAPPPCTIRQDWPVYTVMAGDTLASVAARTGGMAVDDLARASCLPDASRIEVGQQIRVPRLPAYITSFTTSTGAVEAVSLAVREGYVNVSWVVGDRPAGTNLVFEQVMPSGTVYNVELPRDVNVVSSSGSGNLAPILPRGDATQIRLRMRLVTSDNRTLDSRELSVPVVNPPQAGSFTVSEPGRCFDSPYRPGFNLTVGWHGYVASYLPFKGLPVTSGPGFGGDVLGLLASGTRFVVTDGPFCFNTSLPVASSTSNWRQWKVRVENSNLEGWVIEYAQNAGRVRLNIGAAQQTTVYTGAACYQSPFPPARGLAVGGQARALMALTLWVAPGPDAAFTNIDMPANATMTLLEGPYCYRVEPSYPAATPGYREWRVRIDSTGQEGWTYEYGTDAAYLEALGGSPTGPQIVTFTASPASLIPGQNLTVSWDVRGANNVSITWRHNLIQQASQPINGDGSLLPLTGQITFDPPDQVGVLTLSLNVPGALTQYLEVPITCQYAWQTTSSLLLNVCPTGDPQPVQAAYQPFENGFMLWQNATVWAFYTGSSQGWFANDTWAGEEITFGQTPPEGRTQPVRGFGKLWVTSEAIRQSLGWATAPEQAYTMQLQSATMPGGGIAYAVTLPDGRRMALRVIIPGITWDQPR